MPSHVDFDLSGVQVDALNYPVLTRTIDADAIVTSIEYNIFTSVLGGLVFFTDAIFELSSPNLPLTTPSIGMNFDPGFNGYLPFVPSNDETVIFSGDGFVTSVLNTTPIQVDVNLGYPFDANEGVSHASGSVSKLNDSNATGEWTLRLYNLWKSVDPYEYQFESGSYIRINYVSSDSTLGSISSGSSFGGFDNPDADRLSDAIKKSMLAVIILVVIVIGFVAIWMMRSG